MIEHVRDGSTFKAILVPSYQVLTVAMSGIKVTVHYWTSIHVGERWERGATPHYLSRDLLFQCPMIKREGDKEVAEPFAEMARFFTEH